MRFWPPKHRWDIAGFVAAASIALPSLWYPFGRDQAAYHYVGEGWLHGYWPYLDAVDHKPPALYVVYALGALLGVERGVRIIELITVLCVGAAAAKLASRATGADRSRDGELGLAAVMATAFYYGLFDFWHTAQTEIWEGFFLLLALLAALPSQVRRGKCLASGVFAGIAFAFKYPAALPGFALGVICLVSEYQKSRSPVAALRAGLRFTSGVALVVLTFVILFAIGGALPEMWDVTVGFNRVFAQKLKVGSSPFAYLWQHGLIYSLPAAAAIIYVVAARKRWKAQRLAGASLLVLLAASLISIIYQAKYYTYHYVVSFPFLLAIIIWGLGTVPVAHRLRAGGACALALIWLVWSPRWDHTGIRYRGLFVHVARFELGELSREEFLRPFRSMFGFDSNRWRVISDQISKMAADRPGATLCVEEFEPLANVLTGLRCSSRFFMQLPLWHPYKNGSWRRENAASFEEHPPTFYVTRSRGEGPFAQGLRLEEYSVIATVEDWQILYRR